MIRPLTLLLIAIITGALGYWLSQNSGELMFSVMGYQVETSVTIAVFTTLFITAIIIILFRFFDRLLHIPSSIKNYLSERRINTNAIMQARMIVELGTDNDEKIQKLAAKLYKLNLSNKDTNIGQVYQALSYDYSKFLQKNFKLPKLPSDESAKIVYLVSYSKKLVETSRWESIIDLLESELKKEPKLRIPILIKNLLLSYINSEQWSGLLKFVELHSNSLTKAQSKSIYVIARYNIIKRLANEGMIKQSLAELFDLIKLLPDFYYSFILITELAIKYQIKDDILKVVKNFFPKQQNSRITNALSKLSALFTAEQLYNLAFELKSDHDDTTTIESKILFIQFALNFGMFDEALKELSYCLSVKGKTHRLCILMAEFCQRTHGNIVECLEWMKGSLESCNDISGNVLYFDLESLTITTEPSLSALMLKE